MVCTDQSYFQKDTRMATAKVSVTLDDNLVHAAKQQAGTRGLSGYLNQR
jgi:hypothetical protein